MTNEELRTAIDKTAEQIKTLARCMDPSSVDKETKPFREHLAALMKIEINRATQGVNNNELPNTGPSWIP